MSTTVGSLIPMVVEQTSRGERSFDIYSRLLNDRSTRASPWTSCTTTWSATASSTPRKRWSTA